MAEEQIGMNEQSAEAPTPEADVPTPEADVPTPEADVPTPEAEAPTPKKPKKPKPDKAAPQGETKGLAEQKRIFNERKKLKADLKARGITSRKDFNIIAKDQGLVFMKNNKAAIFIRGLIGAGGFAAFGTKALACIAAAALLVTFAASTITEEKGSFTINLTGDMLEAGFVLSDTKDFGELKTRLISDRLEDVNNITLDDIEKDVNEVDGPHNGKHYIAYTFYIRNDGDEAHSYEWRLKMPEETLGVSRAVWLMVFEDDEMLIYTRPAKEATESESAVPEELFGFSKELKFNEYAKIEDETSQYYSTFDTEKQKPIYGVKTKPYEGEDIIATRRIDNVPANDPEKEPAYDPDLPFEERSIHKYTVVIWVEGYDPDCTDDIFGGFAKFEMEFENVSENKGGWFDGLFQGNKVEEEE